MVTREVASQGQTTCRFQRARFIKLNSCSNSKKWRQIEIKRRRVASVTYLSCARRCQVQALIGEIHLLDVANERAAKASDLLPVLLRLNLNLGSRQFRFNAPAAMDSLHAQGQQSPARLLSALVSILRILWLTNATSSPAGSEALLSPDVRWHEVCGSLCY